MWRGSNVFCVNGACQSSSLWWSCTKSVLLCLTLCDPMGCRPLDSSVRGILQDSGVGCHALLQGIFLTQGSNWSFLLCRQILYHSRSLGNSCCHEHKYTDAFFNPQYFLRRKIFHISGEFQVTHVLYIKLAFWIQPVWLTDNNSSCSFDGKTPSFIS